jgi:hypothetical protein
MKKLNLKKTNKIKITALVLVVLFNFFILELASFSVLSLIPNLSYDPNKIQQNFEEYLSLRDNYLGWDTSINKYRNSRNLINRINVIDTTLQIDLYGDSFTYGEGIQEESKIWSNLLSINTNLIVNNKGVGGFGSDQSYLKYRKNRSQGKIIVLNHLSENIIRNINQFRHFIYPATQYDFKPIFIIDTDSIKLIEMPDINLSQISKFKKNPNTFLKHDYFKVGKSSGIIYKRFPFTITLTKSVLYNWKLKAQVAYFSGYQPFYEKNHKSNGLEITKRIIENFNKDVIKDKSTPIVTIIPTFRDFEYYNKYGEFPYQSLIESVNEKVVIFDFGKKFLEEFSSFDLNLLLDLYIEPAGHMNENGHRLMAKVFSAFLVNNKYL